MLNLGGASCGTGVLFRKYLPTLSALKGNFFLGKKKKESPEKAEFSSFPDIQFLLECSGSLRLHYSLKVSKGRAILEGKVLFSCIIPIHLLGTWQGWSVFHRTGGHGGLLISFLSFFFGTRMMMSLSIA